MSIRYSDDFKKEVVKAYMAGDKSTVQIAADYNIAKSTISRRKKCLSPAKFHAKTQEEFVLWREAFRSELKERLGLNLLGQEAKGFTSEICLEEEVQEAGYQRVAPIRTPLQALRPVRKRKKN